MSGGLTAAVPLLGNVGSATGGTPANEAVIVETLGLTPRLLVDVRRGASVTDGLGLSPSVIASYGQVIVERLRFSLTQQASFIYQSSLADTLRLVERLLPGV